MKYILIAIVLASSAAWARKDVDFNKVLLNDVQKDIKKDDEFYKKRASRGPASVEVESDRNIQETPKIDKNIRQIGPNKW